MKKIKLLFVSSLLMLAPLTGCSDISNPNPRPSSGSDVKSVKMDVEYMKLEVGQTLQLNPTIEYYDGIVIENIYKQWMTSNSKVALVSQTGFVEVVGSGRCTITYLVGLTGSASCVIEVPYDEDVDPTPGPGPTPEPGKYAIYVSQVSAELAFDETLQLTATQYNGEYDVTWSVTSGGSIVTVSQNGLVTAGRVAGTATVTASANGESSSCTITVKDDEDDESGKTVKFYFFIDYNNVDEKDKTGKKLLAEFRWYPDRPVSQSGLVPANPTVAPTNEFTHFIGWSYRAVVDESKYLIDVNSWPHKIETGDTDTFDLSSRTYVYIFGIWSDVAW